VKPSLSPSMDIQVSSNFERLLFDLHDRDGLVTKRVLDGFRESGRFAVSQGMLSRAHEVFRATGVDDTETTARIARTFTATGEVTDPHSAIGIEAAVRARAGKTLAPDVPVISIATAHPAKFPDAVVGAIGSRPALPPRMADLMDREEHFTVLANDFKTVSDYIAGHARAGGAAA
jgi:threonine synthase